MESSFFGWISYLLKKIYFLKEFYPQWGLTLFWFMFLIGRYLITKIPNKFSSSKILIGGYSGSTLLIILLFIFKNPFLILTIYSLIGLLFSGS